MTNERGTTTGSAPPGEWLFRSSDAQVFGPVGDDGIVELLSSGSIGPATEVARDGGPWQRLSSVPRFLVEVKKAEARARVEAEVRAAQARARRAAVIRWAGVSLVVATLAVVAARAASFVALERPWRKSTALLDDFRVPITAGTVLVSRGARGQEIAVPLEAPQPTPRARAAKVPGSPADGPQRRTASVGASGIVLAHYDPTRIGELVARQQASLAPCIRDEARRSPDLHGEIPIEFAVGNDGRVAALWIQDARFKSGPLHECMFRKLREWSFDPFPGERPVVSLAFHVGSR